MFFSNLLRRYAVTSQTKRVSKEDIFNQFYLTKITSCFFHILISGICVLVILNLLEYEVQLFVSLCSHFCFESPATFRLHTANLLQAIISTLFFLIPLSYYFSKVEDFPDPAETSLKHLQCLKSLNFYSCFKPFRITVIIVGSKCNYSLYDSAWPRLHTGLFTFLSRR